MKTELKLKRVQKEMLKRIKRELKRPAIMARWRRDLYATDGVESTILAESPRDSWEVGPGPDDTLMAIAWLLEQQK